MLTFISASFLSLFSFLLSYFLNITRSALDKNETRNKIIKISKRGEEGV